MPENESLLDKQVAPDEPKANRRKLKRTFIVFILVGLVALVGNGIYRYYRMVNSVAIYEKEYNARIAAENAAKMADTYGGKTPAETLSLYIEAVKKGDYELASKYFVEKYRQKELDSYKNAEQKNIDNIISLLEGALLNIKNGQGSYDPEKIGFVMLKPILVDFELYPNGIWKIIEV